MTVLIKHSTHKHTCKYYQNLYKWWFVYYSVSRVEIMTCTVCNFIQVAYRTRIGYKMHHKKDFTEVLSISALLACVYIYIHQLSSFRAPTLWFVFFALTKG